MVSPTFYYTDDQLAALGRKRASVDQRNEILELAEEELDELNEEFWNLIRSSKGCKTEKDKPC